MKYIDINKKTAVQNSTDKIYETKKGKKLVVVGIVLVGLFVAGYVFRKKIMAAFDPVQIVANFTSVPLKETDGRTNILLLGSDQRTIGAEEGRSILTDTLLVASIGKVDKDVVLISIPRDLWVEFPGGGRGKINEAFIRGGSEGAKKTVEMVLGIPIHYYAIVTFDLFTQSVDALGGVDVEVENSFTDNQYPIEGKENAPMNERYETVAFTKGIQKMDGATALKYVRSRHGNNNEGTDFARSRRQQKLISAIKNKAFSLQTLFNPTKLKELYDVYANNVTTDIDFGTVQSFYLLSQQVDFSKIVSVVLDDRSEALDGGLLYAPEDRTLYANLYVLIPRSGDYSQIHAYVQKYLFDK